MCPPDNRVSEPPVSADRCNAIIESSEDAIISKDLNGIVLTWNPAAERIFGYRADEMIGTPLMRLVPPDREDEERDILARVARNERVRHAETQRVTKSGKIITISVTTSPIKDAAGNVVAASKIARDITDRKENEAALQMERDRAQRYLDTADVMLLALDVEGRVTSINRKGCDLLGWREAELLGKSWIETCLPERIRDDLESSFDNLLNGDTGIIENAILTRDGSERLIEWRNRVLYDEGGTLIGTLSSGTDITEHSAAERALAATEERMRFALENADVGIWDVDYATASSRVSPIMEKHYGLESGSFAGTLDHLLGAVHPDDRATLFESIRHAERTGGDFTAMHRSLWPDGTVHWLNDAGRIQLDENGKAVRGVGISLDVTRQHHLEEQYIQAQKMEAVGRLAGGIAHDFNNLLTAILGYCQLALSDLDPRDPLWTDIEEIQKAGLSGASLTRQLLAVSRKEVVEPTILDLNAVLARMRGMLGRVIGEDIEIIVKLAPEAAIIKADAGQMEQVLLNLTVNARDAMPDGGKLTIEIANIELEENHSNTDLPVTPGRYVALTVTDTGTGIAPEVRARLFEPFFTTKDAGKGTGLGLAMVHGIVTHSGGGMSVDSEVGKGTTFKIFLPMQAAGDTPEAAVNHEALRARGETVLVVEDAAGLRELVKRMLQRQGYRVLLAATRLEALRIFHDDPNIHVVLTDIVISGGSGLELARLLIAQRPVKIVYMSGYLDTAVTHHGVLEPGTVFVQKPFTSESLGSKIREVLDSPIHN